MGLERIYDLLNYIYFVCVSFFEVSLEFIVANFYYNYFYMIMMLSPKD